MTGVRRQTMRWLLAGLVAGGILLVQMLGEAHAQAPGWKRLQAADFPARVQAVVLEEGVWSAEGPWAWGQWKTRFGPEPVADSFKCDNSACPSFRVEPITCSNAVLGESPCTLTVSWRSTFGDAACVLSVQKPKREIPVRCPVDMRFK